MLEALAHVLRKWYSTEDAESCLRPAEEGSADRRQLKDIAEHAEVLRRFHLEVLPMMREAAKRVSLHVASRGQRKQASDGGCRFEAGSAGGGSEDASLDRRAVRSREL